MPGDYKALVTLLKEDEKALKLAKEIAKETHYVNDHDGEKVEMTKWLLISQWDGKEGKAYAEMTPEIYAMRSKTWFTPCSTLKKYHFRYSNCWPMYFKDGVLHMDRWSKGNQITNEERAPLLREGYFVIQEDPKWYIRKQKVAAIRWTDFVALMATL